MTSREQAESRMRKCPHNVLLFEKHIRAVFCAECRRRWKSERVAIAPGALTTKTILHDEKECQKRSTSCRGALA